MPERLTGGGKANLPGRSLQQRECGKGLQHSGLLVIAIPVDHAMRATERSRCIDGVDRGIDARILARRHGCLHVMNYAFDNDLSAVTRSRVQRLPWPVTRPFRLRMPAIRSSLAMRTSWRTAASMSAEMLLRCPRRRLGR